MSATTQNTRMLRPTFADVLKAVWPRHTSKQAAAAAGMSVRTAQAWVAARCSPSADTLFRMAARNDALRAEVLSMLSGETADAETLAPSVLARDGEDRPQARGAVDHSVAALASEG